MAGQENQFMNEIYIANHDLHAKVGRYLPATGEFFELMRDDVAEQVQFSKGFYVNVDGNIIGVFATHKGPLLFWNHEQFLLESERYSLLRKEVSAETYLFTLKYEEKELSIEYPKAQYVDYDNWSDEEMMDFFLWLYNNHQKKGFYTL